MHRSRRVATAAVLAIAGLAAGTVSGSADAQSTAAHHPYVKAKVKHRTLYVTGSRAADTITLRVPAATPQFLTVDLGNDGTPDLSIDRSRFDAIVVRSRPATTSCASTRRRASPCRSARRHPRRCAAGPTTTRSSAAPAPRTFDGGLGNDVVDGNQGNDLARARAPATTSSSGTRATAATRSTVAHGHDVMTFNGSGGNETFESSTPTAAGCGSPAASAAS